MEAQVGGERALVLCGRHPVLEALRSGTRPIDEILVDGKPVVVDPLFAEWIGLINVGASEPDLANP